MPQPYRARHHDFQIKVDQRLTEKGLRFNVPTGGRWVKFIDWNPVAIGGARSLIAFLVIAAVMPKAMRFANLLVSTIAATTLLTSALAQQLSQLDVVLPGHRLVVNSSAVAFEYADRSHLITAAAGDTNLVFVAEPLNQQIAVLDKTGIPYWATVPIAGVICLGAGFPFGLPALRLEGLYLALATLALAVATPQILKFKGFDHWTGGVQGIQVDPPAAPDAIFGIFLIALMYLMPMGAIGVLDFIGVQLRRVAGAKRQN